MLFKYTGVDHKGEKISSVIDAVNMQEAKRKLRVKKILYSSLEESKFQYLKLFSFEFKRSINTNVLANISRDISIYLNSGISLSHAIHLLKEQYTHNKSIFSFLESIHTLLQEGKDFFNSLEQQKVFQIPTFYKQSIKVSENSGLLSSVLIELATFIKEKNQIQKQIIAAMAYPMFIIFVSFFVVGFMLSFIVPKITSIFTQFNQELPAITIYVIKLGNFFQEYYLHILIGFLFVIFTYMILIKKSRFFKYKIDLILLYTPFLGSLIQYNELNRFAYMNSMLIRSGIPIVKSFKLSSNILKNSVFNKIFTEASEKMVEGEKLSKLLAQNRYYTIDNSFIQAVSIGEETSELSNILKNLAKMYHEYSQDRIKIFLSLLEPIFMLIVGSIIGFIVIAMLLPIFSLNLG